MSALKKMLSPHSACLDNRSLPTNRLAALLCDSGLINSAEFLPERRQTRPKCTSKSPIKF